MMSAFNIPIIYMLLVDATGYARYGVTGGFVVDAVVSLVAALTVGALFLLMAGRKTMIPRLLSAKVS
jgi:activator of 2-hydroxyglutaryl-CoA dehydratase